MAVELVEASRGSNAGAAGSFLEAVSTLGRLHHPSLPPVLDGGATEEGALFLVREPVEGRSFETLGGESPGQIVSLLLQVIGGLETLAGERIFHGGLSAQALWVTPESERVRVQITGLGHAAWVSRRPEADFDLGLREDLRDLAAVATRLFGATVTDPSSATPGVQLPLAIAFELEEAGELRDLLERCLRRDPAARPDSYSELRAKLCEALWGGAPANASANESGAPPARLTFTTVPEYTLVQAIDGVEAGEPEDGGEITKVVLPEEVDEWAEEERASAEDTAEDTAEGTLEAVTAAELPEPEEMLTPIESVLTGEETSTPPRGKAPEPLDGPAVAALAPEAPSPGEAAPVPPPAPSREPAVPPAPASPAPQTPPHPPPVPAASGSPPAEMAPPPATGRPGWLLPLIVGLVGLVALAALAAGVLFVLSRGEEPPPQPETPPPAAVGPVAEPSTTDEPAPETSPVLDGRIQAAVAAFLDGEDPAAARRLLAEISPEERAALSPSDCEALSALETSLTLTLYEEVFRGLSQGLAGGDLPRVRGVLRTLGNDEEAFLSRYPSRAADVRRARRAVSLFERAREAVRQERPEEVLRVTGILMETFPAWEGAQGLRESAAVTLEGQSDLLFEQGRYEQALERLAVLSAEWPDREGLDRRDGLIRMRRASERDVGELLTAAERAGEEGRPDDGLALLSGVHATRRLTPRLNEVRGQLEAQLAELDEGAPRLAPLADTTAEFGRDETARIAFRVADDFRVDRVQVRGRAEGGGWEVLPHRRRSGDARDGEYEVEVGPELHGNKVLEYYVEASDVSGHRGGLGSADEPMEVRRKRWFRRLLPR